MRQSGRACRQCHLAKRKCDRTVGVPCAPCGRRGLQCSRTAYARQNAVLRPAEGLGSVVRDRSPSVREGDELNRLSQDIVSELLEYYIAYIHDKPHSLFHCPSLRHDTQFGLVDRGLLASILALAARFHASAEIRGKGTPLASQAQALLTADFGQTSLAKIQGWVVLGNVCGAVNDFVAESLFFSLAIRTAYITGLTMPQPDDGAVMSEMRCRTWWTLVMLDKWSSAGLGLPRQISDQQVPQRLPRSEVTFHQLPIDQEIWPEHSTENGLWAHMITLVQHFGPIQDLNRLVAAGGASEAHIDLTVSRIAHDLQTWQAELPPAAHMSAETLDWHRSQGHGRTLVALHMGYFHYATLLLFQYLDRASSHLPHAATYAERCREHASGFSDLLRTSHQTAGCEGMYNIVGQMTVVSSSVLIHTLLFGDETQVPPAKARLESNFEILMKLKEWWPSVGAMTTKLYRFQRACLDSVDERTHKVDRWMINFLLEHGSQLGEKIQESALDTSPRSAADLDDAHWLSARNEITREALSQLRK